MSETTLKIDEILNNCILSGNFSEWQTFLLKEENSSVDAFINLLDHSDFDSIIRQCGFETINEWFSEVNVWKENVLNPLQNRPPEILILYHLWCHLENKLIESVRKSRLISDIPPKGGIFYFLAGLQKCLVIKYEIFTDYPKFEIVDVIDNPKSVFDFWSIMDDANLRQKNILKEILSTGHKMVFLRNVLVHVDRRKDIEVFGPAIDTVLIAELLIHKVFESNSLQIESALEIGCGNGLIAISIAKNCPGLKNLYAIDINFNSVNCCYRNLKGNLNHHKYENLDVNLTYGRFNQALFKKKFDLIVCNPPYIPLIEEDYNVFYAKKDYFDAVGGLELIDEILLSLDQILTDNGHLLLLVSSLSLEYTVSRIPLSYNSKFLIEDGFEVLFDVESVLNNKAWLDYLKEKAFLKEDSHKFYHKLYPIWITKNKS